MGQSQPWILVGYFFNQGEKLMMESVRQGERFVLCTEGMAKYVF